MPRNEDPPNPYRDMKLRELHDVMNERAGALLKGSAVSRRDLAYLLLAASKHLAVGHGSLGSPAYRVSQGVHVADAFWPDFESDLHAVMHKTFGHAREALDLTWDDLHRYSALKRQQGMTAGWGTSTTEELRIALEQLQAVHALKMTSWQPTP